MLQFLILAALLTTVAVATVVVPLIRRSATPTAPIAALLAGVAVTAGAALLYAMFSNWSWQPPAKAAGAEPDVAHLARQLERDPDDLEGWMQLGRAHLALQQFPLAARAYQRADRLAGGKNVAALTGLAEALALGNEAELDGRAGQLLERALALDPHSAKALYYGALVALRRADLTTARERFQSLLDLAPPENIQPILRRQIAMIDAQLASQEKTAPGGPTVAGPVVRVSIQLAPALQSKISGAEPLFVFVRSPGERGPPLAARRLQSRFPQPVELTPADAMMAGRSFHAGQDIEVVARVSLSGQPTGAKGDLFGQIRYQVGQSAAPDLVIDRLMP